MRSSILKDLTKTGKPPCNGSHENYILAGTSIPEDRVSKLNPPTWTEVICGVVTPKDNVSKNKTPLTMLNFSCKKGYMKLFYLGNVVVLLVQLCHYKTANLLNLNLLL